MANLTSTNAANLGHGGASGSKAKRASGRAVPKSIGLCAPRLRGPGYPSVRWALLGAANVAAAELEAAAVATPSAISTPTAVDMTPSKVKVCIGANTEAGMRAIPENDVRKISKAEGMFAIKKYFMDDATVGLKKLFTATVANAGNSGAAATWRGLFAAADTVRTNIGLANACVVVVIDMKGRQDLTNDAMSSGSSFWANAGMEKMLSSMIGSIDSKVSDADGFWFSPDGITAVVVENDPAALDQDGGDRVGCAFIAQVEFYESHGMTVPDEQKGGGDDEYGISEAFAIVIEPLVAEYPEQNSIRKERTVTEFGVISTIYRPNDGSDGEVFDMRVMSKIYSVLAASACKYLYLA